MRLASASVGVVRRVLPDWRQPSVVEVPATSAALDRALDAEPGHTAGIAAVTGSGRRLDRHRLPVHVFVNPEVFDRLQPTGAQVVLSHEAVHVATDAARSDVALAPRGIRRLRRPPRRRPAPLSTTAGRSSAGTPGRRAGAPARTRRVRDRPRRTSGRRTSAWLACVLLAESGEQALVDLYDDVADGRALEIRARAAFGITEAGLTRRWQRRLADLAG